MRGVEGGSPPITPPSRAGRHPSRRRRGLSRGVAGVAGHIISVKTATCTWTPIGGGEGKLHGRLRANTSTLQRSPRVPPQLQFSNLRLTGPGGRNSERAVVYPPTFTSGACGRKTSPLNGPFESRLPVLVLLETNSKDYNSFEKRLRRDFSKGLLLHNMFWSSQRASNVRHKCKQHRRRLQHRTSTYIAKACHHALCSTILYTATIQPLYSHYTATIQPLYSPKK